MTDKTNLLRQLHPDMYKNDHICSEVFLPKPKDNDKTSVYDGDQVNPREAFKHYTTIIKLKSCGVIAVTVLDCNNNSLNVAPEPLIDFPQHACIDFSNLQTKGGKRSAAMRLRNIAKERGLLYQAISIE
jgi:hypothetical protein